MRVVILRPVAEFLEVLEKSVRADVLGLVELLGRYGHRFSMPYAKPIGGGLWELRRTGRPQIRIIHGFCHGEAVLLRALKKQRSALPRRDIELSRKLLAAYCG